jgi:Domain of unknown function (DU1801)
MTPLDNFYETHPEPIKSTLLALREIILRQDQANITAAWKYGMPFFSYNSKIFSYLWVHKKELKPYIGIVEGKHILHPDLIQEKRSRMKIMLFDPNYDLPIGTIEQILKEALDVYKTGKIKI